MATLKANPAFNAKADATILRKAMQGLGTDEDSVIGILTKRVSRERQEIHKVYDKEFQRDLIEDLKSELGGKFENLIIALSEPIYEFLAREINRAVSGLGTEESDLTQIICTLTPMEVLEVSTAYEKLFQTSVVEDISSDSSGDYKKLLVSLLTVKRNTDVNSMSAVSSAKELYNAGEGCLGTDEDLFIKILSEFSHKQLELIFNEYENLSGKTFLQAVKEEMSGHLRNGIETIAKFVTNPSHVFAEQLHSVMNEFGTDDSKLIRILVWRSEIDLQSIKNEFSETYERGLENDIAGETSGDYEKALISILHGN